MNVAELCEAPSESRAIWAIRLRVANYKTTLSSNSLETGTDSSNSLPSATESRLWGSSPPRFSYSAHTRVSRFLKGTGETYWSGEIADSAELSLSRKMAVDFSDSPDALVSTIWRLKDG